jgi:hypothetical protein
LILLSSTTGFGVKDNTPEVSGFVGILATWFSCAKDITLGRHYLDSSPCPGPPVSVHVGIYGLKPR